MKMEGKGNENGLLKFSIFTSEAPTRLSKAYSLDSSGNIIKHSGGQMVRGAVATIDANNITELAEALDRLNHSQAVSWGTCAHAEALVRTKQARENVQARVNGAVVARDREHFRWPIGLASMMIDYDPKKAEEPLCPEDLLACLYEICPYMAISPHVCRASASGHIYRDGVEVIGARGWRVLVLVAEGHDIPRAGKALFERAWVKDYGHIEVSKSGAMLVRALVDNSVWQPERLDFCAGAVCTPPLSQKLPPAIIRNPDAQPLDTRAALPDLNPDEIKEFRGKVAAKKKEIEPESAQITAAWIEARVEAELAKGAEEMPPAVRTKKTIALREKYTQAVKNKVLLGDFELLTEAGENVTVGDVLDDPDKYHNTRFHDPLEPDYRNDVRIAWINLRAAGRPYIFSYAHGGQRFKLHRARREIEIVAGERARIVQSVIELMRIDGTVYERGGELVTVRGGAIMPLDVEGLQYELDKLAQWKKWNQSAGAFVPADVPKTYAAGLSVAKGDWQFPHLTGVITAPTMSLPDGRIIDLDGYDQKSGLLLSLTSPDWPGVPARPVLSDIQRSIKTLWTPFKLFPFDSAISRGVFLSALLAAGVCQALPTAPGVLINAPAAGSGKSLLAKCLAIIAGTEYPVILPNVEGRNAPDEIRKRLLSIGREGANVLLLDNVAGTLASSALCAWITSEQYCDRVLGASATLTIPTRSLLLITGNNVQLKGDLCRRVLSCRIDPAIERPWRRKFILDPAQYCREHRLELVAAALTLLRYGLQNVKPLADRTASFELWSDTVRRAVVRCGEDCADPVDSIDSAYELDPETNKLVALLTGVWAGWMDKRWTVSELISEAPPHEAPPHDNETHKAAFCISNAIEEIAGISGGINKRVLGRWLEKNAGRIVSGLQLTRAPKRGGVSVWRVKIIDA